MEKKVQVWVKAAEAMAEASNRMVAADAANEAATVANEDYKAAAKLAVQAVNEARAHDAANK